MAVQPPPPPSINPHQMNMLRIVAAMAWSDGELSTTEVDVMLDRFSELFAQEEQQRDALKSELRDYMMQNIPLEELTPHLQSQEERELVLHLGYEVIASSSRSPSEPKINPEEAQAYQKLKQLLDLPPEVVQRVEADSGQDQQQGLVEKLTDKLRAFFHGKK